MVVLDWLRILARVMVTILVVISTSWMWFLDVVRFLMVMFRLVIVCFSVFCVVLSVPRTFDTSSMVVSIVVMVVEVLIVEVRLRVSAFEKILVGVVGLSVRSWLMVVIMSLLYALIWKDSVDVL